MDKGKLIGHTTGRSLLINGAKLLINDALHLMNTSPSVSLINEFALISEVKPSIHQELCSVYQELCSDNQ